MNNNVYSKNISDWSLEFTKVPTVRGTNSYKYVDNSDVIYGSYITIDEMPCHSTMIKEFRLCNPDIPVIEILDLYVKDIQRKNGVGTGLLKMIQGLYDDYAILLLVGASKKEYPELDEDNIPKILERLLPFYEKNNFVNVNTVFGSYSNHVPMLYIGNSIGQEIAKKYGLIKSDTEKNEAINIITEKEKLIKFIESIDGTFENFIVGYIAKYSSDFSVSRLNKLSSTIADLMTSKIESNECAIRNSIEYATYLKKYLEGNLYSSKEVAEAHVDIQINNVDSIIRFCNDAINK